MHNSTSELFLTDKENYSLWRDCLWRMISLSPLQKSLPVSSLVKKKGLVLVLRLPSFHMSTCQQTWESGAWQVKSLPNNDVSLPSD